MMFVVLGGGVAALNAATALRERDHGAGIVMVSGESHPPYSRPMLTKAALRGFRSDRHVLRPSSWYTRNAIDLRLNQAVTDLDLANHVVTVDSGERIRYDRCVYALGASSFIPPIPGTDKKGVIAIRTFSDIARLRSVLLTSREVVVIGGGVIGLEAAWEVRRTGRAVTVLEMAPRLMGRLLDEESADVLREHAEANGVTVRTAIAIESLLGDDSVTAVRLTDGSEHPAQAVIVSCGVRPNISVAKNAGLGVERGVVVSPAMATSDGDIFACGDCAEMNGVNHGLWSEAAAQGTVAGANAAGDRLVYSEAPPSVMFSGMTTSLFAFGDIGRDANTRYHVVTQTGTASQPPAFLVNSPMRSASVFEKYFFTDGRVVGGVLMGDLRKMAALHDAIVHGERGSQFHVD